MKLSAEILLEVLARQGVRHIVCNPGTRNAPLLTAADRQTEIRKHIIIDERAGAFYALGLSLTLQQPVALICTSGTALLNYAPAVAEAYYRHVPLIVVSADRPIEWIDQDDSQTLRQHGALGNFVKKSYDVPEGCDEKRIFAQYAARIANDAFLTATSLPQGPVHINVQFDEPLNRPLPHEISAPRIVDMVHGHDRLAPHVVKSLADELSRKRILLVCGFHTPDHRLNNAVRTFASLPNVYVMTEIGSNLNPYSEHIGIDTLLANMSLPERKEMLPDVVMTLGGSLVSRFVKAWLRNDDTSEHWALGHSHTTVDCFLALTKRLEADPAATLAKFAAELKHRKVTSDYAKQWEEIAANARHAQDNFIANEGWSDLIALNQLFRHIPREYNLHLSNGTSIRYAQLLCRKRLHAAYCNRGVSGIDGSTSTAIGSATVFGGPTLLLTGDMSFAYDIGALSLPQIPDRLKIAVLSNDGGNIFRFIETTKRLPQLEEYFCTQPNLPLPDLAKAYGFEYLEASDSVELQEAMKILFDNNQPKTILNIKTEGAKSAEILNRLLANKL